MVGAHLDYSFLLALLNWLEVVQGPCTSSLTHICCLLLGLGGKKCKYMVGRRGLLTGETIALHKAV
jgi:hypothetical protein